MSLLVERAARCGPWMAHWIDGRGCCWIDPDREALVARAAGETARYAAWRADWQPGFAAPSGDVLVVEEACTAGGPVGASGSPMALFACDRHPVTASEVREAFAVAERAWADIRKRIAGLAPGQRSNRPAAGRRTIEETLEHLGNCFWWYCSRIDDDLPEWPDSGLSNEERADAFLRRAKDWSLGRTLVDGAGGEAHLPSRYPTDDQAEPWTLGKVIRRQAEHLWEHRVAIIPDQ